MTIDRRHCLSWSGVLLVEGPWAILGYAVWLTYSDDNNRLSHGMLDWGFLLLPAAPIKPKADIVGGEWYSRPLIQRAWSSSLSEARPSLEIVTQALYCSSQNKAKVCCWFTSAWNKTDINKHAQWILTIGRLFDYLFNETKETSYKLHAQTKAIHSSLWLCALLAFWHMTTALLGLFPLVSHSRLLSRFNAFELPPFSQLSITLRISLFSDTSIFWYRAFAIEHCSASLSPHSSEEATLQTATREQADFLHTKGQYKAEENFH